MHLTVHDEPSSSHVPLPPANQASIVNAREEPSDVPRAGRIDDQARLGITRIEQYHQAVAAGLAALFHRHHLAKIRADERVLSHETQGLDGKAKVLVVKDLNRGEDALF